MEDEAAAAAAGDEAEAPPAPKRKLSRKAQIKELAKRKKERSDAHYQPDVQAAEAADDDAELPDLPVEQPGEAAKRAANAYKKRRSRLRGLGSDAQFTAAWLASAPENQDWQQRLADKQLAAEVASKAVAAAIAIVEEERVREMNAQYAARKAEERRQKREMPTPEVEVRNLRARLDSTPDTAMEVKVKPKLMEDREVLTADMKAVLSRIYQQKHLRRDDVVGGSKLSRSEWEGVRRDHKELQRIYALQIYVTARDEGLDWIYIIAAVFKFLHVFNKFVYI